MLLTTTPADGDAKPAEQSDGLYWNVDEIAGQLRAARHEWRGAQAYHAEYGAEGFPSRANLVKILSALAGVLFPLRLGPEFVRLENEDAFVPEALQTVLSRLYGQIRLELIYEGHGLDQVDALASGIIAHFARALPQLRRTLDTDVEAAYAGDPAARSVDEVLICYPGIVAIIYHRVAHLLWNLGAPLVARIVSAIAYGQTGIDIHPAARIGEGFFIDHGNGVVIGQTAIIGDRVRLYHGVTLGALGSALSKGRGQDALRHPIIDDDVTIYAGATVLGRIIVGKGSVIFSNVCLTESVPAGSVVKQAVADHEVTQRLVPSAPHRIWELRDGAGI